MTTKLHIDIHQGIIDVEGDPELVREIYADFKTQLLSGVKFATSSHPPMSNAANGTTSDEPNPLGVKPKPKRRTGVKKKAGGDDSGSAVDAENPKLDKNLDTAKLPLFYAQFAPKNHSDKILIFLMFLTEQLGVEKPDTDQVYTCYKQVGEKFPQAFKQAFHTANTNYGYIDFKSASEISIPIAGQNRFSDLAKLKAAE